MGLGILKRTLPLLKAGLTLFPQKRQNKARVSSGSQSDGMDSENSRRIAKAGNMKGVVMLHGAEPREILQTVIEKKVSAVMSYLSRRKWHVAKVQPTNLGANRLAVCVLPGKKPHPINVQVYQPVGISLKYEYGKFIFESKVVALEPPPETAKDGAQTAPLGESQDENPTIVLAVPDRIEVVQRRSYFRVDVPESLKVNVLLWHRLQTDSQVPGCPPEYYWQGKLVDISAGGAQVAVPHQLEARSCNKSRIGNTDVRRGSIGAGKPDFKKGQFIGLRFTPMPYERPLQLCAQIRNILPTADGHSSCLGLQIVGLEASPEGRQVLSRLLGIIERYYQINQSSIKQQDMHAVSS